MNSEADIDFLSEDNEISGQKFVLLSFLSPDKVIAKKELFFFEKFLVDYELSWKSKNLEKYLADTITSIRKSLEKEITHIEGLPDTATDSKKSVLDACNKTLQGFRVEDVLDTYREYVKVNQKDLSQSKIKEAYEDFMFHNKTKLEDEYLAKNKFQTTMRGLKVRGVWNTQEEATARAKKLQRSDPNHNILLGSVGKWLPWDPSPSDIQSQEYAEEQLNTLMKKYTENEENREEFYSKNPNAKTAKGEKSIFNIAVDSDAPPQTNTMFDGTGDIALSRKMENLELTNAKKVADALVISEADKARAEKEKADALEKEKALENVKNVNVIM